MRTATAAAVRETVADLCDAGLPAEELMGEVAARVRRVVPHESSSWMTADPITLLPTTKYGVQVPPSLGEGYCKSILLGSDRSYERILASGLTARSLAAETGGDLASDPTWNEVGRPAGLGDELRFIASDGETTWGYGCLSRVAGEPHFSDEEVRYVGSIAAHLGFGIRRGLATRTVAQAVAEPGMLVLRPDMTIEARTGAADHWMTALGVHGPMDLPVPVFMTAMVARAHAAGAATDRQAVVRAQAGDAGWVLVHAAALEADGDTGRTAVMLEPADRAGLLPLLLALHGLTAREREVARLLVTGRATDDIAGELHISRHTLRDHVKAIFGKVGVTSRPALTAALA